MRIEISEKVTNWLLSLALVVGFSLQIYIIYFGYNAYHFLVPPGSDAIAHYNIVQKILTTGKIDFFVYPPGFHLLIIAISKVFHVSIMSVLTYWTPMLVVLPSLCMFFLLRQLFDYKVSVITTLLFLLASSYPLNSFIDGNYPDILAYGVFAILLFAFLIRYLRTKNWINLIISGVFLLLVAFTHHLTFVSIMAILFVFGLVQIGIIIVEKKLVVKVWCWKFLASFVFFALVAASVYFSFKFYGTIILKYADGLISNNPALQNQYLNQSVQWSDYSSIAGNVIWYFGLIGLLFLLVTTFNQRKEIGAKQLVLIWFTFFFIMSRFSSSAIPARFARELAPAMVVGIGFLLNYIFNLNSLKTHRYKLILGFGLIGFIIIINSALFTGPAQIPESFKNMVWFWQKDQDKIDYITSHVPDKYQVLYNPAANLYTSVKAPSNFLPLSLNKDQFNTVRTTDVTSYVYKPISAKKALSLTGYAKLIYDLHANYAEVKYVFIDVKPPSNPDDKVYPKYANFPPYNKVLDDLALSGTVVKKFPDGSRLIRMY